ncbi:MAG: RluA family pseudouridine synthase [Anaerovoracaceae bacterium]
MRNGKDQAIESFDFKIEKDSAGKRIDRVIVENTEDISRSRIQKLFDEGAVTVNGEVCSSKNHKVREGDEIAVEIPEPETLDVEPEDIPLDIVYEDDSVLVVNKPRGMVVHPAAGNMTGTLVNAVLYHCGDSLSSINGVIRPGIVHRIDKDTSGLIMIAKDDNAHIRLSEQLQVHSTTRRYLAIVRDNIKEDEGTVDAGIGRDPKNRLRRAVHGIGEKRAVTHYKVLERFGKYTYIECRLETGRTHQIRVHMAYIKHPLLGDTLYGSKDQPFGLDGQMLHAAVLGFLHPVTGEYMEFRADPPEDFQDVLNKLRNGIFK